MINEEEIDRFADAYEANTGNFPTLSMAAYDGANWAIKQLQPEIDALEAENDLLKKKNLEKFEELARLKPENERLRSALQGLLDEQNGPPLLRRETQWTTVVKRAQQLLNP